MEDLSLPAGQEEPERCGGWSWVEEHPFHCQQHQADGVAHLCHLSQSGGPPDFFFNITGEVENRQVEPRGVGGEEEEDLPLFEAGGWHFSDWSQFFVGCIHPVWWHPPDDGLSSEVLTLSLKSESESHHLHLYILWFLFLSSVLDKGSVDLKVLVC